jgi:hypothetical protein
MIVDPQACLPNRSSAGLARELGDELLGNGRRRYSAVNDFTVLFRIAVKGFAAGFIQFQR